MNDARLGDTGAKATKRKMLVTVSGDESFEAKFEILKRARRVNGPNADAIRRNLQRGEALRDGGFREMLLQRTKGSLLAA